MSRNNKVGNVHMVEGTSEEDENTPDRLVNNVTKDTNYNLRIELFDCLKSPTPSVSLSSVSGYVTDCTETDDGSGSKVTEASSTAACVICNKSFRSRGYHYAKRDVSVAGLKRRFCEYFNIMTDEVDPKTEGFLRREKYPFCATCYSLVSDLYRRGEQLRMSAEIFAKAKSEIVEITRKAMEDLSNDEKEKLPYLYVQRMVLKAEGSGRSFVDTPIADKKAKNERAAKNISITNEEEIIETPIMQNSDLHEIGPLNFSSPKKSKLESKVQDVALLLPIAKKSQPKIQDDTPLLSIAKKSQPKIQDDTPLLSIAKKSQPKKKTATKNITTTNEEELTETPILPSSDVQEIHLPDPLKTISPKKSKMESKTEDVHPLLPIAKKSQPKTQDTTLSTGKKSSPKMRVYKAKKRKKFEMVSSPSPPKQSKKQKELIRRKGDLNSSDDSDDPDFYDLL